MIQYPTLIVAIVLASVLGMVRYVSRSKRPRLEDPLGAENGSCPGPLRVLVLTAAVGGGHEAAGRSVGAELEGAGHSVVQKDGLRAMSRALGWLLVRVYLGQARNTPGSLGILYAITSGRSGAAAVRAVVGSLFAGGLLKAIREERPDLVVSTYPLVTAALGHLRKGGKLGVPAAAIIADYGAHPLWVAPGVDLHLVVSRPSAELISRAGGEVCVARLPVAPKFRFAPARETAREILGLPREALVTLIVGGAWGIGDLGGAARRATESGACAIIVTGNNAGLKSRLEEEFGSGGNVRVLGWREDVPVLMAASDCLIQNAGGMTCLEAIEMGLPIVIFEPLKGHGELNARIMERAGDAHLVSTPEDLGALVRSLARREVSLPAPSRDPEAPKASAVLEALAGSASRPAPKRRSRRGRLVLAGAIAVLPCFWLAFSSPGTPTTKGLHLGVPGYDAPPSKAPLALRVADPETADPAERERPPVAMLSDARRTKELYPATGLTFEAAEESPAGKLPSFWSNGKGAWSDGVGIRSLTGECSGYFPPWPEAGLAAPTAAPPRGRSMSPGETGEARPRPGLVVVDASGLDPGAARLRLEQAPWGVRHEGRGCELSARL